MVFSSLPVYLDPPNWQQQNNSQGIDGISVGENSQFLLHSGAAQQQHAAGTGSVLGPFRPGSMADRARIANLPLPEVGLKCPRCESTNTKFCYFNNYCLSQPRHFCKACRRYWTKGGALRNVPVGGGCRRNKKNKRASSKSPASVDVCAGTEELVNHHGPPFDQDHTTLPLRRFPSLDQYSLARRLGLSFPEYQTRGSHEPSGTCESGCPELTMLPAMDVWRPPEIKPFHSIMTGLEQHPLFQLEGMTEPPQMSTIPSLGMAGDPCGIQPGTIPYSTANQEEVDSSFVLKMAGSSQSSNVVDYWLHPSSSYI